MKTRFDLGLVAHMTQHAIMINPLQPGLPKIPIMIMPTCNKFTSKFVKGQWSKLKSLYNKHLCDTLGPLIGHASDGDARRRKIFLEKMTSKEGERFQPIQSDFGFVFSCKKTGDQINDLCDSDFIHCHKKLINHLDSNARSLEMGSYLVHLNHVHHIYTCFPPEKHGLSRADKTKMTDRIGILPKGCPSKSVRDCLSEYESKREISSKGTFQFLEIVWMYAEVFCRPLASLKERVKYAATACHYLGISRNWIAQHKTLTLKRNFLTRETFLDVIILGFDTTK